MDREALRRIVEALLMASERPLSVERLQHLLEGDGEPPTREEVQAVLADLQDACQGRGFELKEVASGFRFQVRQELAPWVSRLWEERPPRYSRALLETLALIAYRQPVTRAEIEEIRGVSVSTQIMRTLQEREWVRVVAHREVPGRPALYGTTRQFLDYFNLRSLDELPSLADLGEADEAQPPLDLEPGEGHSAGDDASEEPSA